MSLPFDVSFALSSLWKRVNTWSSFAGMLFCCTKHSVKLLSELRYQDMISDNVMWIICYPMLLLANNIIARKLYESFYVNIIREIYISIFFDTFVKNEFCNRIINSMDLLYSNSVNFCIEQLHQVFQSVCLV